MMEKNEVRVMRFLGWLGGACALSKSREHGDDAGLIHVFLKQPLIESRPM